VGSSGVPHPAAAAQTALRRYQRWAFVMAAVALAAGVSLLPAGDELLLIHVRNHDIGRARQVLADGANLGVSNAASVTAHSELYLLEGQVDEALEELEQYVADHPDEVDAWKRLAQLNQNAQRLNDQTLALEHVNRLTPDETLARQLAALYRWAGDERAEATRLRDLVVRGEARVDEYLRGARLAAAFERREEALDTLERLRWRDPGAFGYGEIELYASLLLDLGHIELLAQRVQTMPLLREQPHEIAQLAAAMRGWGRIDAALALLDPLPGMEPSSRLLEARARTAVGTSEAGRVVNELAAVDRSRRLDPEVFEAFVQLAVTVPDYEAIDRALSAPGRSPSPIALASAIGGAVSTGARQRAQSFIARFGDDALADSPILALDLAVERGDTARAEHWIGDVAANGSATPEQIAALAQYESKLGLDGRAFDRLTALAASGRAPEWALGDLAAVATRLHREEAALATLASASSRSRAARGAWIRLAASSGNHRVIEEWLTASTSRREDAALLRDLYFLLSDRRNLPLATTVAHRLYDVTGDARDGQLLGQVLLAVGRPGEALAPLRRSHAESDEAARAYDSALAAALLAGDEVSSELRTRFAARLHEEMPDTHRALLVEGLWAAGERAAIAPDLIRLARSDLDRWLPALVESVRADGSAHIRREAIAVVEDEIASSAPAAPGRSPGTSEETLVRALVDLGASDEVLLPRLERMAFDVGETWIYALDHLLERNGKGPERVELWARVGAASDVGGDERRAAAARLVDLGARDRAAAVMQDVAAGAGPTDQDVQQLLWLWGPAPTSHQIDWLVSRLRSASAPDRSAWMVHLTSAGAASRVVDLYRQLPTDADGALIHSWIDAHRAVGNRADLGRALDDILVRPDLPAATLQRVGSLALGEGLADHARRAYGRLAASEPGNRDALRWLGALAFYDGRSTEARQWLRAYLDNGGADAEPLYQMGELALALHNDDEGRTFFERAHDALTGSDTGNPALLANVLVRLDDRMRARGAFELMLGRDPDLDHVRADYAAALMHWRDWERAREVLQIDTPSIPRRTDADPGAARRVDLLRVQWLTYHGRYARTSDLLTDLAWRFPRDPDVLLARGRFDADRGRPASADRDLQMARLEAPDREDIATLIDDAERARSPRAGVQLEARSVGNAWDERMERASIVAEARPHVPVAFLLDRLHVSAPAVRYDDGRTAALEASPTRFEATSTLPLWPGVSVTPTLMGTDRGAGLGITVTRHDLRGASTVIAERGRPYWEFLEAVASDGRRDRVGVQRQWRFRADTAAWALVDLNTYRLASGHRAATAALGLGMIHTIRQGQPTLTLQYGLDKEHRRNGTVATTPEGVPFAPVPLASREVHLFGAIARFNALRIWEAEATGGYTFDRLGGRGTFMSARLTPRPTAAAGIALWAERRLYTVATTERVLRAGMSLAIRF
jgi:tetratricopeptide (TPR) repeat protein